MPVALGYLRVSFWKADAGMTARVVSTVARAIVPDRNGVDSVRMRGCEGVRVRPPEGKGGKGDDGNELGCVRGGLERGSMVGEGNFVPGKEKDGRAGEGEGSRTVEDSVRNEELRGRAVRGPPSSPDSASALPRTSSSS